MLEALFELLAELLGELLLPLLFEALFKGGGLVFVGIAEAMRRVHWALASAVFALTGALMGVASLALFPRLVLQQTSARGAYIVLSPLIAGAFAYALARFGRRGEAIARRAFVCWLCFSLCFALVRAGGVGPWGMLRPH